MSAVHYHRRRRRRIIYSAPNTMYDENCVHHTIILMAGLQSGEGRMMIDSVVRVQYINVTDTQTATSP